VWLESLGKLEKKFNDLVGCICCNYTFFIWAMHKDKKERAIQQYLCENSAEGTAVCLRDGEYQLQDIRDCNLQQ
jgi:hypothetical protein